MELVIESDFKRVHDKISNIYAFNVIFLKSEPNSGKLMEKQKVIQRKIN